MKVFPFVPFYAGTLVLLFAGFFLSLKRSISLIFIYMLIFCSFVFLGRMPYPEFFIRMAIIILFAPFMIPLILARRNIFHQLEIQSIELGNMSNVQMLAELSGSIAHEINNPLFIISGLSDRIKRRYEKKVDQEELYAKNFEDVTKIRETVDRISNITNSLLEVDRKTTSPSFESHKIEAIIYEAAKVLQEKLNQRKIKFSISNPNPDLSLECTRTQIFQVFVNLISNSCDALDSSNDPWIKVFIEDNDANIRVLFSDSGFGIAQNEQDRVLEPFFTTKEAGKGTGLGLSICQRICETHQGKFQLLHERENTTFEILLPKKHT